MPDGYMLLGMTSKSDVRDAIDNSARNIGVLRRRLHDPVEPSSDQVASLLPDLTVIRTTSPLDHRSTWIEVFPREVSKSQAAAWLAARHGIRRGDVCAVGNDYNDRDLLEWAGSSYVVANAAPELRTRHDVVAAGGHCGVAEAIRRWRSS